MSKMAIKFRARRWLLVWAVKWDENFAMTPPPQKGRVGYTPEVNNIVTNFRYGYRKAVTHFHTG